MEPILRTVYINTWITIVLFVSLSLIVLVKKLFYSRFINFIILPLNNKYIFLYNKKNKIFNGFNILFTIFQLLNLSLFIYISKNILFKLSDNIYLISYPYILGLAITYLFFKTVLQFSSGYIFNVNRGVYEFVFKRLSYFNYSSYIMFVANIILTYTLKDSEFIIYGSLFLIVLINGLGWLTIIKTYQKKITNNFFFFILYLCVLEIVPLLIIGSYLKYRYL